MLWDKSGEQTCKSRSQLPAEASDDSKPVKLLLYFQAPLRPTNLLALTLPCVLPWLYPDNHSWDSRGLKPPALVYLGFFSFFLSFFHSCHICVVSWKQAAFGCAEGALASRPSRFTYSASSEEGMERGREVSVRTCELKVKRGVRFSPYGQRVRGRQRTPKCWWSHWRSLPRTETRCPRCEGNSTCALTFSPTCALVFRLSHLERKKGGFGSLLSPRLAGWSTR